MAAPSEGQRMDAYPEHTLYVDRGCNLHPHCLTCPFEQCRYDLPAGIAAMERKANVEKAERLRNQGHTAREIAAVMKVSKRTVHRYLEGRLGARKESA